MNELRLAFAFLTRFPVGRPVGGAHENAVATRYYPLVGAALFVPVVAALVAGAWLFDRTVGCVFALLAWTALTGGLHLDGLADCVDGMAVNGNAARRLQVMHDPRIGGLGAAATALWILLKFALLARCVDQGTIAQALWCALIFARTPLPFELAEGEPATPGQGLFAWLHPEVRRFDWGLAVVLGLALLSPAAAIESGALARVVVGVVAGGLVSLVWHLGWYRRVGGLSGDILGGAVELREVVMLLVMGAHLPW